MSRWLILIFLTALVCGGCKSPPKTVREREEQRLREWDRAERKRELRESADLRESMIKTDMRWFRFPGGEQRPLYEPADEG